MIYWVHCGLDLTYTSHLATAKKEFTIYLKYINSLFSNCSTNLYNFFIKACGLYSLHDQISLGSTCHTAQPQSFQYSKLIVSKFIA